MTNIDPDNGVAFGYIHADALRSDLDLLYNPLALDLTFEEFFEHEAAIERRAAEEAGNFNFDTHALRDRLWDEWNCEEPVIEGEFDGVTYRSSWLGGALHFFILKSPYITHAARRASTCDEPNAGILNTLDGNVTAYDVPPNWRA